VAANLQVVSAVSFLAGIIGWIMIPDDTPLWLKHIEPLLTSMTKYDLIIVFFALVPQGCS
jgi:hypothetical protein